MQLDEPARDRLLADLRFGFDQPKPPAWYRLGLVGVALLMLLLPAAYLAIIAATGWAIYWHATTNVALLESKNSRAAMWSYMAPILVGAILVSFMFKPIFARRSRADPRVTLDAKKEPFLFAFVSELCATLGAPKPRSIHVDCEPNASVGFHQGTAGLFGGKRALTIGLPLAAGMTLQQLAGILAHEFGHLGQGFGMRLGFAIRTVSAWFARVAFERDDWDKGLAEMPGQWRLLGAAAGLFIQLTRAILRGLASIGSAASCWLSRRMELDADGFEVRVVGSDEFESSSLRGVVLQSAASQATSHLAAAWDERRLADDLPALIAYEAAALSDEDRAKIEAAALNAVRGPLATHPAVGERITAARRASREAAFRSDLPASVLFTDFGATCRDASFRHYQAGIGKRVKRQQLVPVAEAVAVAGQALRQIDALGRYFQSFANLFAPIPLADREHGTPPHPDSREEVASLRRTIVEEGGEGRATLAEAREASARMRRADYAAILLSNGIELNAEDGDVGATDAASCQKTARESEAACAACRETLAPLLRRLSRRLAIDLGLLEPPARVLAPERAAALRTEAAVLVQTAAALNAAAPAFESVSRAHAVLSAIVRKIAAGDARVAALHRVAAPASEQSWKRLNELRKALEKIPNGVELRGERIAPALHIFPTPVGSRDLKGIFNAGSIAHERFLSLYFRTFGRLAEIGEEVERAIGLGPLPSAPERWM